SGRLVGDQNAVAVADPHVPGVGAVEENPTVCDVEQFHGQFHTCNPILPEIEVLYYLRTADRGSGQTASTRSPTFPGLLSRRLVWIQIPAKHRTGSYASSRRDGAWVRL